MSSNHASEIAPGYQPKVMDYSAPTPDPTKFIEGFLQACEDDHQTIDQFYHPHSVFNITLPGIPPSTKPDPNLVEFYKKFRNFYATRSPMADLIRGPRDIQSKLKELFPDGFKADISAISTGLVQNSFFSVLITGNVVISSAKYGFGRSLVVVGDGTRFLVSNDSIFVSKFTN